jgi:hypothetical protein
MEHHKKPSLRDLTVEWCFQQRAMLVLLLSDSCTSKNQCAGDAGLGLGAQGLSGEAMDLSSNSAAYDHCANLHFSAPDPTCGFAPAEQFQGVFPSCPRRNKCNVHAWYITKTHVRIVRRIAAMDLLASYGCALCAASRALDVYNTMMTPCDTFASPCVAGAAMTRRGSSSRVPASRERRALFGRTTSSHLHYHKQCQLRQR